MSLVPLRFLKIDRLQSLWLWVVGLPDEIRAMPVTTQIAEDELFIFMWACVRFRKALARFLSYRLGLSSVEQKMLRRAEVRRLNEKIVRY